MCRFCVVSISRDSVCPSVEEKKDREKAREKSFIPVNRCARPARLGGGMGAYRTSHHMSTAGQELGIPSLSHYKEARTSMKKVVKRDVSFDQCWHPKVFLETDKAKELWYLASRDNAVARRAPRVLGSKSQVRSSLLRC